MYHYIFPFLISYLRLPICSGSLGFLFGASYSSLHIHIHKAPDPLQSPSSGKLLQWPRCVSKQSGCEMAEICRQPSLPPFPPLLSVSSVHVPRSTTRGRDEAGMFCVWLSSIHEKRELKDSSSPHPHQISSCRSYTTEGCPRLDVHWEAPSVLVSIDQFLA